MISHDRFERVSRLSLAALSLAALPYVLVARTARAQAPADSTSSRAPVLRISLGPAVGADEVLSSWKAGFGLAGTFQYGGRPGRHFEVLLDVAGHAFRVENPVADEAFRALYIMPAAGWHGDRAHVDGGVGGVLYLFSGPDAASTTDGGLAAGVSAGWRPSPVRAPKLELGAFARLGATTDGELTSYLFGVSVGLSPGG